MCLFLVTLGKTAIVRNPRPTPMHFHYIKHSVHEKTQKHGASECKSRPGRFPMLTVRVGEKRRSVVISETSMSWELDVNDWGVSSYHQENAELGFIVVT